MAEKPSVIGTVFVWMIVLFAAVAFLAHATPTGRRIIRKVTIPIHGSP